MPAPRPAAAPSAVARTAGGVTERTREKRLPNSNRAKEDDVLALLEEREVKQIAHAVAVEAHGRVPIERP